MSDTFRLGPSLGSGRSGPSRRRFLAGCGCCAAAMLLARRGLVAEPVLAAAAPKRPDPPILFREVRVFDGLDPQPRPAHVLVADRKVAAIATGPTSAPPDALVI